MQDDDDVAARLRSVLAAAPDGVRDQAAPATPAPAHPGGPGVTARYASGLGGLTAARDPLNWSDIIPAWPDDVDLEPLPETAPDAGTDLPPEAVAGGARVVASGVVSLAPVDTGGFRPGTPWASPPASLSSHLGDLMDETRAPRVRPAASPPAWVLPEEPQAWGETMPDEPPLTAAGAFGGETSGRRFGLGAFDPGRRGVKALAVVAALVLVIAAVLAWRARPQVDNVAPPSFETTDSPSPAAGATRRVSSSEAVSELVVAVGGKVRRPGLVRLAPGSRVADALNAAGGADTGVDVALLNLARKLVDGELIMVGVTPPPGAVATGPAGAGSATGSTGGLVNLNTATLADLDGLPGVGPVLAQRILDARDAQGGFKSVGDLRKVDGIGDARYEQLKDLVTV